MAEEALKMGGDGEVERHVTAAGGFNWFRVTEDNSSLQEEEYVSCFLKSCVFPEGQGL